MNNHTANDFVVTPEQVLEAKVAEVGRLVRLSLEGFIHVGTIERFKMPIKQIGDE